MNTKLGEKPTVTHAQSLISALFVLEAPQQSRLAPLIRYLQSMDHLKVSQSAELPEDLSRFDVVVTVAQAARVQTATILERYAAAGGGWLELVQRSEMPLPPVFGARIEPLGPQNELRVLFNDPSHPLAVRLPDAIYVQGHYHPLRVAGDGIEPILYADWHYQHTPVLLRRPVGDGAVACSTLQDFEHPVLRQIFYRLLRALAGRGQGEGPPLGVGILGYAPWVGKLHGMGVKNTVGLQLQAVCDVNPLRLKQAEVDFPGVTQYDSAMELQADPAVDLVIVATPPNTHAALAVQMLEAGKHIVCEKPLALNRRETDTMVAAATRQRLLLSCHQNRRWDTDYLAIRRVLADGLIGDLFYMETFVGGYNHPCGYWHSEATVSGGAAYDWGGHYVDWIVSLIPERITGVIGTRHKRVWHDVTNADQERIQLRFAGGQEAEFLHSDIAGLRKPKWYLLGTEGALVGNWRDVTEHEIDPLLYFHRHDIPATEMPPQLLVQRRDRSGKMVPLQPALPDRRDFAFHRNLADHLQTGEPLVAPLADSVKVVAVLEAAARSMGRGGSLESIDD
ncbi:MAG TPA: Gfo/Idh/MocA family oxidoreductase [Desulfobacterales bacterium]